MNEPSVPPRGRALDLVLLALAGLALPILFSIVIPDLWARHGYAQLIGIALLYVVLVKRVVRSRPRRSV